MNEYNLLKIIKNEIDNDFIGDDCAYLKDFGIVITQDSLVEDIHFKRSWCTPYQLGYKSVVVNISDVLASGAVPKYLTISLSIPNNIDENYIKEFYKGAKNALNGAKIVGGDITGSADKFMVSITAIGSTINRNISSRKHAKEGYIVITSGNYGSSAAGLNELINGSSNQELIKAHLEPSLDYEFSNQIATIIKEPYAMMDTSDGFADAVFKIAELSNVKITVDYDKIPHKNNIPKDLVLFGGEDYNLIAAIPEKYFNKIKNAIIVGKVSKFDGVRLNISGEEFTNYNELRVYNHFGGNNG